MHVSISGEMIKIDKVKNYKYVGHTVFEATSLWWVQCVELCARMSVCKSMNYLGVGKICQINNDAPRGITKEVKYSTGDIFMLAEVSNKGLTGLCKNHTCNEKEICITALPHDTTFTCLPITLS